MPEALAVVAVFVVTAIAYVGAWLHARDPAKRNVLDDIARLRHHAEWLQSRLEVAQRENWETEMIASLSDELENTLRQLAALRATIA
jgi:hypothetical protein